MPETLAYTPEELDEHRRQESLRELTEQGGLEAAADDPFSASEAKAKNLSAEEVAKITLAHDYRDARKLNFLINQGDLTSTEASEASTEAVHSQIKRFDEHHILPLTGPNKAEEIEPKQPGHLAEDAIAQIINESGLKVHAEHGSDYQDNLAKADLLLFVPTMEGDVLVKVQNKSKVRTEDIAKVPANALLVELAEIPLPPRVGRRGSYRAEEVLQLASTGNLSDKRIFASKYLGLALDALKRSPANVYPRAKKALGLPT